MILDQVILGTETNASVLTATAGPGMTSTVTSPSLLDQSPTTGDPTSPASALLVVAVSGLHQDNVPNVLKVGKSARRFSPTQSASDEIEAFPTAVEAVEDTFAGGVQFIDPVDGGPESCDVGGQPPVASALAGPEDEPESRLRPL